MFERYKYCLTRHQSCLNFCVETNNMTDNEHKEHGPCRSNCTWNVPLAGNAFITSCDAHHTEVVTAYVPCEAELGLRLKVPFGKSSIKVTLKNACCTVRQYERTLQVEGSEYKYVAIGDVTLNRVGYMQLELQGVERTGHFFADVSDLVITCRHEIRCVADDFYFGRRGPSVHLKYKLPCDQNVSYFYNEIIVPEGEDAVGAYFCAAGFDGGYFGIQANSGIERRILFSIWSTYNTDNPACIPDEYKIRLIRKGDDVYVGEFGNEGSGGQSFLRYNWKSEVKYKFLVNATPLGSNETQFTAWFWPPEKGEWMLIASFLRPREKNFIPETGHICRTARFGNQWIRDCHGCWHEITAAELTGDATSKRNRQDFAGGVVDKDFFLRNCGFFNESIQLHQNFERCRNHTEPSIAFHTLP
ncbi:hypothetical protein Bhyg_14165 [Pseudolycoriella hygida]|uniref:DUF5077 domain-containing protein n=1 Tax=Pseudolycoriella hygida TaxID=35572 RepID=A0A9Q0MRD6_9DIPT|nr:hypothetical protein Bhyg_14165 [Pseudolycoriella hygida]